MTALTTRDLDGIHNFRALAPYPLKGGGTIRPGMVYRSGALELMTDADCAYLSGEARIALVLDLRHPDEWGAVPIDHALRERVAPLSLFPETHSVEGLIAELNGLYGTGPSPERYLHYLQVGGSRFAQAFDTLSRAESYPVLVHCTAGKDRTGVLLGLLMDLLGAEDEDIAKEYGLSDDAIPRLIAYLEATGRVLEGTREEIVARLSTPPERMAGFIALMRERYGGADAYLRGQGVSAAALARVREILVER
ncbi:MAG: tyrosine-protein phosphatase [Dehalococcoidia bacterium]